MELIITGMLIAIGFAIAPFAIALMAIICSIVVALFIEIYNFATKK